MGNIPYNSPIDTRYITYLVALYAEAVGISLSYAGKLCANDGKFYARLLAGGGCTLQTYRRVLQWFADHWPADLPWPAEISRPAAAPDSPAAQQVVRQPADSPLHRLNRRGRIADPDAFIKALGGGTTRSQFDQVVAQYGDGRPRARKLPRRGCKADVILRAVVAAGDSRFAERAARHAEMREVARQVLGGNFPT